MAASDLRKKSPRAPSIPLEEAIERALRIYEKERRHAAPADIIAQDIGYKSANNGAALSALASLRYFGLLDRLGDGKLAITKDVEDYRFAPSDSLKRDLEVKWLKSPPVFSALIEKFGDRLPSDAVIRFELIQGGFNPSTVEGVLETFKKSVEFVGALQTSPAAEVKPPHNQVQSEENPQPETGGSQPTSQNFVSARPPLSEIDRIPIRLSGGRKAWLEIPSPFFEADKARIRAQIDLLLSEDEEGV